MGFPPRAMPGALHSGGLGREAKGVFEVPRPVNLSAHWTYGSMMGRVLAVQLVTGVALAAHYLPAGDHAFDSCVALGRDVGWGWLLRGMHANGASFFFVFMYLHLGRGVYYGSYRLFKVWVSGVLMLAIVMGIAFLGYVLVWGQIRFWAATVITRLLSVVPRWGLELLEWVWGGFGVSEATLQRFFVLHFVLPFVLVVLVVGHLAWLHESGSNNPAAMQKGVRGRLSFHSLYTWKDLVGRGLFAGMLLAVTLLWPGTFVEPENLLPAREVVTPRHIQPEWYFLWAYAVLRCVPRKRGGVLLLLMAFLALGALPFSVKVNGRGGLGGCFRGKVVFWFFVGDLICLTWLGRCPAEAPYVWAAQCCTLLYFVVIGRTFVPWAKLISGLGEERAGKGGRRVCREKLLQRWVFNPEKP